MESGLPKTPITLTKISIPRQRKDFFSRQRLLDLLNDFIDSRLTIVAAPAGYGKTALLIDFAGKSRLPVCWFSIDSLDSDIIHFLSYLIHSIKNRFPDFGESSLAALHSRADENIDIEQMTATIINDLIEHVFEHFVIVLDDYHLIENVHPIESFISRFVRDMDENCHLIIASRALLTLPELPLMVSKAQVSGLSYEELAFTAKEIQSIYQRNYHQLLDAETTDSLVTQTEGWITGLILAAQINAQSTINLERIKRVTGISLYDYLAEQVFLKQTKVLQTFLMFSALLEEFDAAFCKKILHGFMGKTDPDWNELLNHTLHANLFAFPVGDDRVFIRYHPLFRQFLTTKALEIHPAESNQILRRLADHLRAKKDWLHAHAIYSQIGDHGALVRMLVEDGTEINTSGHLSALSEWLDECTEKDLSEFPQLLSLMGSVKGMRGQNEEGFTYLNKAIPVLRRRGLDLEYLRALLRRSDSHRLQGNYKAAIQDAARALKFAEESKKMIMPKAKALRALGISYYHIGSFANARSHLQKSLSIYKSHEDSHNIALVSMELGLVLTNMGEYPKAEKTYRQALDVWSKNANPVWQANLANNLGVLYHQTGQIIDAIDMLDRGYAYAKQAGYPRMEAYCLSSIGDIYYDLGAFVESEQAYSQAREINSRIKDQFLAVYLCVAEAEMALIHENPQPVVSRFQQALQMAKADGSNLEIALTSLHYGRYLVDSKNPLAACKILQESISIFEHEQNKAGCAEAHLYLSVAMHLSGQQKGALEHLMKSVGFSQVSDSWSSLIIPAKHVRVYLQEMSEYEGTSKLAGELLDAATTFDGKLPALRRQIRQRNRIIPLGPPRLVIRGLGAMQVRLNNKPVTNAMWISLLSRDLFFYMLHHARGITKEQVGLSFWPEADPEDIRLRFKNALYRLRRAVGREVILFEDDSYVFNSSLDFEYDVSLFLDELERADREPSPEHKYRHLTKAIQMYKGAYLPSLDIPEINTERERLQQLYEFTAIQAARLAFSGGNHAEVIKHCQQAIGSDPYNETAYQLLFRCHAAMGNKAAIQKAYIQLETVLRDELGITPSDETRQLIQELR